MLDKTEICARIPHALPMCLLERVDAWDESTLVCGSATHRDPDNPLRHHDRLDAVCAIEYAAQAMALHGALLQDNPFAAGRAYLGALRGIQLHLSRLDDIDGELRIKVERMAGDQNGSIYGFEVSVHGRLLVEGRATVINEKGPSL